MALISLTEGLAWYPSGKQPGTQVQIPANFGTLGSVPQYRRQRYDIAWGPVPNPELPAFNDLKPGAQWRATANQPGPFQPVQPGTPAAPVLFSPPQAAALQGAGAGTPQPASSVNAMLK